MKARQTLLLAGLGAVVHQAEAQSDALLSFTNSFSALSAIPTSLLSAINASYVEPMGQSTITSLSTSFLNGTIGANATATAANSSTTSNSQITIRTTSPSLTVIGGNTAATTSTQGPASSTSSSAGPTNTLPCNGFPEFCNRKYSNITNVCSHNSAFVVKNNAASNQQLPITDQLNDGIRMLQGETHWVNNTIYNCHTNCNLLNAGTFQSELETVRTWLQSNPYEVLTILISNSDQTSVENYVPPITNAGLLPYVYEPAYIPQYREQWPTLGEMILRNQRLVFFMDYRANQAEVPYILDQYSHLLQTPFSPTNRSFPCTIDYPQGVNESTFREKFMYLANHNLNQAVDISAILGNDAGTILIPNTAELNVTNAQGLQLGELGAASSNCTSDWNRPPNFLVVDYYNIGSPEPCSVFHVAAAANNVTYAQTGCGNARTSAAAARLLGLDARTSLMAMGVGVLVGIWAWV